MLNEQIIQPFLKETLPAFSFNDIFWKTQDSNENGILFYRFSNHPHSLNEFSERINSAQFSWLILNQDHPKRPARSCVIDELLWPDLQKKILDLVYPLPAIKMFAITGTNGKTTTTDLVLQLGELIGKKGLSIGTLGVREYQKLILEFGLTSPCLIDLRKFLYLYGKDKDFCVLEASSHALCQDRYHGIEFDMAGWTSFSQDHLDYHQSMEAYFEAKLLLLSHLKSDGKIFIPRDQIDLYHKVFNRDHRARLTDPINKDLPLFFSAQFNRNNLEVALSIIENAFAETVPQNFERLTAPDGRFYIKSYKSNYIVVDFAHTPDALENICRSLKKAFPSHQLKVLFGCGGDRDRSKRAMMGQIAEIYADQIYLTSDNPRSENPEKIIDDIAQGIKKKKPIIIPDRLNAVQAALKDLTANQILLLAGKGHENYILINDIKYPYSDIEQVMLFLEKANHD